ncbi:sugar ABC transporter substrate-binding protein, partial [Mariniblastus sp.]|nr:sugar ABC transporter substrate-binding protein [Mariniblastus sp.]
MSRNLFSSIVTVILLIAIGCGSGEKPAASYNGKPLKLAVIPKGTSHEFWKSVHFGAEKAAKELGNVEIVWRGPVV